MAEAAVEERSPNPKFFCHKCSVEFENVSPEYTCPHCLGGFIEELEANAEGSDEVIDVDDDDHPLRPMLENTISAILVDLERRAPRHRFVDPTRRRRALTTRITGVQHQAPYENLVRDFILNLGVGWDGTNQMPGNMLFLGNPGDYAWGREGLDAIVTQLLNQMDGTGPPPLSKEVIRDIPTVEITREQVDTKVQCSVCWEDFVLGEHVRKLPCQHVYHEGCICPWLELHGTCPICRQNLCPGGDQSHHPDGTHPNGHAGIVTDASGSGSALHLPPVCPVPGSFATVQDMFHAVQDVSAVPDVSVTSTYSAGTSSDSASSSSNSSSSGPTSDRYTGCSSSSDSNTDVEFN